MRPTAYRRNARGLRDRQAFEHVRMQAGQLFAAGRSQAEVACQLGVARQNISRWHASWRHGRLEALRSAGPTGPDSRLSPAQLTAIDQALRQGACAHGFDTDHWTLARITIVIEQATGVGYHPGHTWKLAELQRQREATARDLATLDNQQQPADTGAVELLDALPVGTIALQGAPEPTLRRLFVAFQLQVRYDKHANWATLRVTLQEDRLDELLAVAGAITDPHQPPAHGDGTDDSPPFAHAVPVPGHTAMDKSRRNHAVGRTVALQGGFSVMSRSPGSKRPAWGRPGLVGECLTASAWR